MDGAASMEHPSASKAVEGGEPVPPTDTAPERPAQGGDGGEGVEAAEEPPEESSRLVTICTLAGNTAAQLWVKPSDTVRTLKQLLWARTGTEVAKQRLFLEERELEDMAVLEQCAVTDDTKLSLICMAAAEDVQNRIQVLVRCRPPRPGDADRGSRSIVTVSDAGCQVTVDDVGEGPPRTFAFKAALDERASQRQVFDLVGHDAVQTVLEGYNTTFFFYGQTASGKSHSLLGTPLDLSGPPKEEEGLAPRVFRQLFRMAEMMPAQWRISCAFVQIYGEEVFDLLSPTPPKRQRIREKRDKGGIYVDGGVDIEVRSLDELQEVLQFGFAQNAALTRMPNRKDLVISLTVRSRASGCDVMTRKLQFVECRGCEKQPKTGATGDRLLEGPSARHSSQALGNVISALASARPVVPYRDGALPRLLTDSLGGPTRTIWIAHVLCADYSHDETLSTLRVANRVSSIVNKPLELRPEPPDPEQSIAFAEATWLRL